MSLKHLWGERRNSVGGVSLSECTGEWQRAARLTIYVRPMRTCRLLDHHHLRCVHVNVRRG